MLQRLFRFLSIFLIGLCAADAAPLERVEQLIVSVAPTWDSQRGTLQLFQRKNGQWHAASPVYPALYGKNGLAWGRGVAGQEQPGLKKVERDGRAPAGIFKIGKIYTADSALPAGADFPFHTVSRNDAWPDDPANPYYNQLVTIDPASPPPWFEKQKMRHGDAAYRWRVEIRHNSDAIVPGAGSAIFFHIRRGPTRPSAGCTVLAESDLVSLIRWLRASANPHYVLLTHDEYLKKWRTWSLPDPKIAPLP